LEIPTASAVGQRERVLPARVYGKFKCSPVYEKGDGLRMERLERIKSLQKGKGVQYLLDEAYKIFNNPIVMFDTDYHLIAYTNVITDDPIWNEIIANGTFSLETQMFFVDECFTDVVANADKLAVMKSEKLKYDRILGNIFNGKNIKIANIVMVECNRAFARDTPAVFEVFADLVTDEIREDKSYIEYGEAYQDIWIRKLIDQNFEDKKLYSPHVQILYNGFKTYLYLAVVDVAISDKELKYYLDLFRQEQYAFKYAVYSDYIVTVMSSNFKTFNVKRDLMSLLACFERENIFAGISGRFENLFELPKYYAEAVEALHSLEIGGDQHIAVYKEREKES
jgi:hypothetical protein